MMTLLFLCKCTSCVFTLHYYLFCRIQPQPEMVLGIAHDFGYTNALQWCPSGGYQIPGNTSGGKDLPRLGLLGAACSVGCIVIYAVPLLDGCRQAIYRPSPIAIFKPSRSDHWFGQCLCLDWSRQKGHAKIAAGFGNGNLCFSLVIAIILSSRILSLYSWCL